MGQTRFRSTVNEADGNLVSSKLVLEPPDAFVGGVVSPERTDFGQQRFEQRALLRRKPLLELVQDFFRRGFSFSGRARLKRDKVPDLGQELDVLVHVVGHEEVVADADGAAASSPHPLQEFVRRDRRGLERFRGFLSDLSEPGLGRGGRLSNRSVAPGPKNIQNQSFKSRFYPGSFLWIIWGLVVDQAASNDSTKGPRFKSPREPGLFSVLKKEE